MSVTERFMDPGQFSIPLRPYATAIRAARTIKPFSHVIVLPQRVRHPEMFLEADLLAAAKYAGPIIEIESGSQLSLRGQGMVFWLGDADGLGELKDVSFAGNTSAIFAVMPAAIATGTMANTAFVEFEAQQQTPLEILRTFCQMAGGAVFRVNPNATIDIGPDDESGPFSTSSPSVIAIRRGHGYDPVYKTVEIIESTARVDATGWASEARIVNTNSAGVYVAGESATRTHDFFDMRGNPVVRVHRTFRGPDETGTVELYLAAELRQRDVVKELDVTTGQYDLGSGRWKVGDAVWVWDPPVITGPEDYDLQFNKLRYRGKYINPDNLRIWEADWPLIPPMGVYIRPSDETVTSLEWKDFTRFVDWEHDTPTELIISWGSDLVDDPCT